MDSLLSLCDVWKGRSYVNANVSVSSIFNDDQFYFKYYFLRHRNCQVSFATLLFSIFIHQNTKSTRGLNIYSILEERPKALLKMFFIDVDRLTFPRRSQDVIFEYIFYNAFLYRCFFNIDYRSTYRYGGKHVERNMKDSVYIWITFLRGVQRTCEKCRKVTPTLWCSTLVPRTSI